MFADLNHKLNLQQYFIYLFGRGVFLMRFLQKGLYQGPIHLEIQ